MLISQPLIIYKQLRLFSWMSSLFSDLSSLFPKVFCSSLLTWSFYVYTVHSCYNSIILSGKHVFAGVVLIIAGTILYFVCLYTYFMVIIAGPGSPLDYSELKIHNMASIEPRIDSNSRSARDTTGISTGLLQDMEPSDLPTSQPDTPPYEFMLQHTYRENPSGYRYCSKCSAWKPDRCHHCSTCNRCILRMDHHCPWFASCIGFHNEKFFIQFLVYVTTYLGLTASVSLYILWRIIANEEYMDDFISLQLVFLLVLSISFFITLFFFTSVSIYFVLKNTTTIEFEERRWQKGQNSGKHGYHFDFNGQSKQLGHIYDLGIKQNWESVMGRKYYQWLLPIRITSNSIDRTYENGINFSIDEEEYEKWCANIKLQDQLNEQLRAYTNRNRSA